jgi:putative Mg2+ transporter-C (MgtC) family protein
MLSDYDEVRMETMPGALTFGQMVLRLSLAVVLGAVVGAERELVGKEAGIRTDIMVAAGAAVFSIAAIQLPYLISLDPQHLRDVLARNSGFLGLVANVVVGIGFLGAGIIVKQGAHVRGLTTAATVWFVAAIGVLCGIGLVGFAITVALGLALLLLVLRKIGFDLLLPKD